MKEIYKNKCGEDLDFDCMTRKSQVFYKTWYLAELWTKLRLLSLNRYWCWFVFCLLKDKNQINASQNPTLLQLPEHWLPPPCWNIIIPKSEHQRRIVKFKPSCFMLKFPQKLCGDQRRHLVTRPGQARTYTSNMRRWDWTFLIMSGSLDLNIKPGYWGDNHNGHHHHQQSLTSHYQPVTHSGGWAGTAGGLYVLQLREWGEVRWGEGRSGRQEARKD